MGSWLIPTGPSCAHAIIPSQSAALADFESLSKNDVRLNSRKRTGASECLLVWEQRTWQRFPRRISQPGLPELLQSSLAAPSAACCSPAPPRAAEKDLRVLPRVTNPAATDQKVDLSSLPGGNQGSGSSGCPQLKHSLPSMLQVSVSSSRSTNLQNLMAANIYSGFKQIKHPAGTSLCSGLPVRAQHT